MNPLIAALLAAGVISAEEARTLNGLLNEGATRIEAEQRVAAAFATGFENQRSRLIRALDMGNVDYRDPMLPTFWAAEHDILAREVLPTLTGIAQDVALTATVRSGGLADWRTVNEAVIAWTDTHYRSAAGDALGSIPNLDNTARDAVADAVNRWQRGELNAGPGPMGLPRLIAELQNVEEFGVDRAARIAITETTRILAEAERTAAQANPNMEYLVWQTGNDEHVCFPAGTMVATPTGHVPIERIADGDWVLTRQGVRRVVATMNREYSGAMVALETEAGNKLTCTANHPIWSQVKQGWLQACQFEVGDSVQLFDNQSDCIRGVFHFNLSNPDNCPSQIAQTLIFGGVSAGRVPVCAVDFNGDHLGGNGKVNAVSTDPVFLHKLDAHYRQRLAHSGFEVCFALRTPIASKRTKLPVNVSGHGAHPFAASFACDVLGRTSAFFGTIVPVQEPLSNEGFSAPFARDVFGFGQTARHRANSISVGNTRKNGKIFPAHRTLFGNVNSGTRCLVTSSATVFSLPKQLNTCQRFSTLCASFRRYQLALRNTIARCGTELLLFRAVILEHLATLFARSGFHTGLASCDEQPMTTLYHRLYTNTTRVYDIQVDGAPEFYANGILVHNCPICAPLEGARIPKGQRTFPGGYYPPAHVNCRCGTQGITELAAEYA